MATTRDWPAPEADEPDFIIRDDRRLIMLSRRAANGGAGAKRAKARIDYHYTAIAANLHLAASFQRWRTSRVVER